MGNLKVKKSASAGVHIDEGEYTAIVEGIQINKWEDGNESYGWTFKVKNATLDGDPVDGPVRIRSFASALLTPKSKLFKWAKGAGIDVENEDEIDLEEAIGKTVRISVEDHETKDGATVSKVDKVRPVKKKAKPETEDDDEEEAPKKSKKASKEEKSSKKKAKPAEEEEEPDDDEEEEEAPKKKNKVAKADKKKVKKSDDDDEDELFNFSEDGDEEDEEEDE
jgi:hypothetical protein